MFVKPLVLSTLLILYSIILSLLSSRVHTLAYVPLNLLVAAALLIWSLRADAVSAVALALTPGHHNTVSGMWGVGTGLAIGVPLLVALVILRPYLPFDSTETLTGKGVAELMWRVGIWIPLGTVLLEEFAFRGVLFGLLERTWGVRQALVLSSLAFALWHIGLVMRVARVGSLAWESALLVFIGLSLITFFAGMGLAFVRIRTSSLIGPMIIHYVINSLVSLGLWQPL